MEATKRRSSPGGQLFSALLLLGVATTVALSSAQASSSHAIVWSWGANPQGELGNGTFTTTGNSGIPIPGIVPGLPNITKVAAGDDTSLALGSDGTVWAWGDNTFGQLGNGTITVGAPYGSATAAQVPGLAGMSGIAQGGAHCLALTTTGAVWSWGDNQFGQLGNGGFAGAAPFSVPTPAPIPSLSGVTAIAAGFYHSLALKSDGTVQSWGYNFDGQLGVGSDTTGSPYGIATPVQVPGLSGVVAISAYGYSSLALKADGTVWEWGYDGFGVPSNGGFGDAGHQNNPSPTQVAGLSGITAIAEGGFHFLALKSDGTVWSRGRNYEGQLGYGSFSTTDPIGTTSAAQIPALSGIVAVSAGAHYSLALASDGTLWSWGSNLLGQLGNGTFVDSAVPGKVAGLPKSSQVAAGHGHALAITAPDTSVPTFSAPIAGTDGTGRKTVSVNIQDGGSGLASVKVVKAVNCTLTIAGNAVAQGSSYTFPTPPLTPQAAVATKLNQSQSASFSLQATDACGNTSVLDPLVVNLRIPVGATTVSRVIRVSAAERFLSVVNGSPGIHSLSAFCNGRRERILLEGMDSRSVDLGTGLGAGTASVLLVAAGRPGDSATVMLGSDFGN